MSVDGKIEFTEAHDTHLFNNSSLLLLLADYSKRSIYKNQNQMELMAKLYCALLCEKVFIPNLFDKIYYLESIHIRDFNDTVYLAIPDNVYRKNESREQKDSSLLAKPSFSLPNERKQPAPVEQKITRKKATYCLSKSYKEYPINNCSDLVQRIKKEHKGRIFHKINDKRKCKKELIRKLKKLLKPYIDVEKLSINYLENEIQKCFVSFHMPPLFCSAITENNGYKPPNHDSLRALIFGHNKVSKTEKKAGANPTNREQNIQPRHPNCP